MKPLKTLQLREAGALLFALWLVACGLLYAYVEKRTQESLSRYLNEQAAIQQVAWNAGIRLHHESMTTYFQEYVLAPGTLEILKKAQNPATRDKARQALLNHLGNAYTRMQERGIRQLHFHLPNGDSLLRFHFPHKYGDNLFESRASVKIANTEKRIVSGFETGKVVSGFRNVFPILNDKGEHLGSVELSLPFERIRREVASLQPDREFELVINARQLKERLFESQQSLHAPWPGHPDFWLEDPECVLPDTPPPLSRENREITALLASDAKARALLQKGASGSIALRHGNHDHIITFTAARDIEGKLAGFLVGYRQTSTLSAILTNRLVSLAQGVGSLTLLFAALWLLIKSRSRLKDEKQRLQTIYDTIGEGLYVTDADGKITHANQSARQLLGYAHQEMIGQRAHTLFHAHSFNKNMPLEQCPIFRTIRDHKPYDGLEEFRRKNGSIFTARVFSRPLFEGETVAGSVTTFEDVTEETKTRRMLQTIYDVLPVGITVTDPEGHIIDCNNASETILGITRRDHLTRDCAGKEWPTIRPDGSPMPPDEYASVRALKERRAVRDVLTGLIKPDGVAWISVSALPVGGNDYGVVVAYVDITAQKTAELVLKNYNEKLSEQVEHEVIERLKSEAKYKHLFNAVPDAIMVHGFLENGMPSNFSEVNDAACAMTGMAREALTRISPTQIDTHRPPEETARLAKVLRADGRLEIEEELIHPGGEPRTVLTMARIVNLAGLPTVISVMRDITELKKLQREKELQQAVLIQQSKQAELGSMIGAIAHQWKQPLNAIAIMTQGLIDSFEYNELDRAELENHVGKVMHQIQFMSQTISDFRNFYKPGKTQEPFSPYRAVKSVFDLLKIQLDQHHIALSLEGDEKLLCEGYASEFKQVALNIINNARDAFEEHKIKNGQIRITIEAAQERVAIIFTDNGGGIAPQLLPHKLFEPFNTTKGEKGTGIGLPLSKTIIEEKMQGRLTAENIDGGARFTVELTRHKETHD